MSRTDEPLVVVGAGPVGLVTALRLADHGVRSIVLDAKPALQKQGSKACLIQGDVLEVLDKFGCAAPIAAEGVTWTVARTYVRDREIRSAHYAPGPGFGPFVNISQHRIEQVLLAAAERHPLVEVRWGHEVVGLEQDREAVTLRLTGPEGPDRLTAAYVVACDGVRSRLRELTGVRWTGYTHRDRFLITDIRARLDLPKERHFHYDPACNPGRQLVMHPQPDETWRIDWQLPPDADIEAEQVNGEFDRRVRAVIGDVPYEVDWVSTYRFHQRVVEHMRVGRVFFAGDAAHALPPYGSRGMNSGIQDADNIAWKLALVYQGQAEADLLESYHVERHAAARENLAVTEATIRFMIPPTRWRRWTRAVLLGLSGALPAARDRVNSGRMAEPFVYRESPIVRGDDPQQPLVGSFAPDARVAAAHSGTRLRRFFGAGFVGLVTAPDDSAAAAAVTAMRAQAWSQPASLVVVLPASGAATQLSELADVVVLRDVESQVRAGYGGGGTTCWLVRPDGHIAAASTDPESFASLLQACSRGPAGPAVKASTSTKGAA
ncbi:FAD-dependent monooxygenase [Geodermatophilus sp. DSM 45219]|uniref:FAD-dependent monooxygenase n=1 Tax=Geodermatophilus sp. DSM 45219 TaxID=1881103 RepID=UPI00088FA42C|nr:FAD-dependent monooxygenase [Geodermatophilus sp. DSM 45219]SDN52788.1 3-(3-hydroxy-phenyl)propionate hydroxylase [Geodermatophilus sp. DSM 45219]